MNRSQRRKRNSTRKNVIREGVDWVAGRESDSDEKAANQSHVTYSGSGGSVNAPAGNWVDVPRGMVAAADTYVDSEGVLRSSGDHSCVVWHLSEKQSKKMGEKPCEKKGIQPNEIVYSDLGAPWCPDCFPKAQAELSSDAEKKKALEFYAKRKRN